MVAISVHEQNGVGIDASGNVWNWGSTLGNPDGTPLEQSGVTNVTSVAAGSYHDLAIASDGTLWGNGSDWNGQLGGSVYGTTSTFLQFSNVEGVFSIAGNYASSLLVKQDGSISGFGYFNSGELAANLGVYVISPQRVFGIGMSETPPAVAITTPTTNGTGTLGTAINFQSSASASVGSIAEVDYYLNGVKLGNSTTPGTWDFCWTPTTYGELTFEAVAIDSAGVAQISTPVTLSISYSAAGAAPPAPTGVTVTPGAPGTAYLTWTNPANGVQTILIQEENPDGTWTTIATLTNPTITSYAAIGLNPSQNYNFRVIESNGFGGASTSIGYSVGGSYPSLVLTKISSDPPIIGNNTFETNPLVVQATTSTGVPVKNVPVTFNLASGSNGALALTNGGATSTSQVVMTNAQGRACAFYQTGGDAPLPNDTITATTASGSGNPTVSFSYGVQGLVAWLSADTNVTVDGSSQVTEWDDQGANHYSLTPASPTDEPQLIETSDGHQAIQFADLQSMIVASGISSFNAVTVITVASPASGLQVNLSTNLFGFGYDGSNQALGAWRRGTIDDGSSVNYGTGGTITAPDETWVMSDYEVDLSARSGTFYCQGYSNGNLSFLPGTALTSFSNLLISA